MFYAGSIYILCPRGTFVRCNPKNRSRYFHISQFRYFQNFLNFHSSSFQKKWPGVLKNFKFLRKRHVTSLKGISHMRFCKNSAKASEKCSRGTPMNNCFCLSKYSVYIFSIFDLMSNLKDLD